MPRKQTNAEAGRQLAEQYSDEILDVQDHMRRLLKGSFDGNFIIARVALLDMLMGMTMASEMTPERAQSLLMAEVESWLESYGEDARAFFSRADIAKPN